MDDDAGIELVIQRRDGWLPVDWAELVRCRELLYFLTWRDVKVRYKQTVLGIAWVILQPFLAVLLFTVVFGRFARFDTSPFPYPVYAFVGMIPWQFFANGLQQGGLSLVNQQRMLTKVYLPRLYIPTSGVGAYLIDMTIGLVLCGGMLAIYRVPPSWQIVLLPVPLVLALVATLGPSILLAALTVAYRDFRYIVPFLVQILMYASPVVYPSRMIKSEVTRSILALNPMWGAITAFRSSILGEPWDPPRLAISTVSGLLILVVALHYFRKTERRFADIA